MAIVIKRREATSEINKAKSTDAFSELPPILQQIYQARGLENSAQLSRSLAHLHSFEQLKGIQDAVSCLSEALAKDQRILIIGDYDADGATSSALAMRALTAMGAQHVDYLVPNRFEFGYGLTPEIVEVARDYQPDLLITVDNGIASIDGVAAAKALGMRVLITDHHLAGSELPDADAIINPNQPGCNFPSKNLAGVGVIFYVMLALRAHLRQHGWFEAKNIPVPNMGKWLDLVALGTVADVVPLDSNNRILVHQGLQRIRARKCCTGIQALLQIANRLPQRLVASDLGFAVGPRLNAAGRLEDMRVGIACLLSDDAEAALTLAQQLDALNKERRSIEGNMQAQALKALEALSLSENLPTGLCLYQADWHQGVVGIVASRIKDKLHRPVIAFAKVNENELKGSARSVKGLHIRDALDAVATRHPGLIQKFGGHAMAAGLSLARDRFADFQKAFDEEVCRHLSPADLRGEIMSDGSLQASDVSLPFAEMLRDAGPWGQAFPEPTFDGEFWVLSQRIVGEKHLKLSLAIDEGGMPIDAIAFNIDPKQWPNNAAQKIHAAYRLDVNEYRGRRQVQFMIEHLEIR